MLKFVQMLVIYAGAQAIYTVEEGIRIAGAVLSTISGPDTVEDLAYTPPVPIPVAPVSAQADSRPPEPSTAATTTPVIEPGWGPMP